MTATTFAIDKTQAAAFAGANHAVFLIKSSRKTPAIGEALLLKNGKTTLTATVTATARISLKLTHLARVLDLHTDNADGAAIGRLATAAEQGASQEDQHREQLAGLSGYGSWVNLFKRGEAMAEKADDAITITRQLVAVTLASA